MVVLVVPVRGQELVLRRRLQLPRRRMQVRAQQVVVPKKLQLWMRPEGNCKDSGSNLR